MCGPEDPLSTPLLPLARVPFQAKESVHKTPFWENLKILASTASIFTQNLAHKPPNLEVFISQAPKFGNFQLTSPQIWKFSAHKPPFSEANVSSQAPHFGNPGRTPLPEKKLSAPRRSEVNWNFSHYVLYRQWINGWGMGPLLVLVSPCFRENVIITCKIGSFLCSLDNLLQKNVIVFFFRN